MSHATTTSRSSRSIARSSWSVTSFSAIRTSSHSRSGSSLQRLWPPTLPASIAPVRRHACAHRTPVAGLTSNKSAAARADRPRSSARPKRSRKSRENGLIHPGLLTSGQLESHSFPLGNPSDSFKHGMTLGWRAGAGKLGPSGPSRKGTPGPNTDGPLLAIIPSRGEPPVAPYIPRAPPCRARSRSRSACGRQRVYQGEY